MLASCNSLPPIVGEEESYSVPANMRVTLNMNEQARRFYFASLAIAVALIVPHHSTVHSSFPERFTPLRSTHADRFAPPHPRHSSSSSSGLEFVSARLYFREALNLFVVSSKKLVTSAPIKCKNKYALLTLTHMSL